MGTPNRESPYPASRAIAAFSLSSGERHEGARLVSRGNGFAELCEIALCNAVALELLAVAENAQRWSPRIAADFLGIRPGFLERVCREPASGELAPGFEAVYLIGRTRRDLNYWSTAKSGDAGDPLLDNAADVTRAYWALRREVLGRHREAPEFEAWLRRSEAYCGAAYETGRHTRYPRGRFAMHLARLAANTPFAQGLVKLAFSELG
jgi:hypothetical protein